MLIQEPTYSIYPKAGVYVILSTEDITVNIYEYSDTTTPLRTYAVTHDVETDLEFGCTDGRYNIVVTNGVFTNTHIFIYYPFFEQKVLDEIYSFICNCEVCPETVLDDCSECKEDDDCKNHIAFLSYIIPHMFLYTDQSKNTEFANYMQYTLLNYNDKLYVRYKNMFWYGVIKGTYPFNINHLRFFYAAIYVYYYLKEYSEDTNNDYIDTKYKIAAFKECLSKLGISFSNLLNVFNENIAFGKYYVNDLSAITVLCTEVFNIVHNPTISKKDYESGISIPIVGTPQDIVLITPKSWGVLTEILDNGGANLITDTTRTECDDFYLYHFNYQFPPNNYIFKIVV